jgi:hypothetical protein
MTFFPAVFGGSFSMFTFQVFNYFFYFAQKWKILESVKDEKYVFGHCQWGIKTKPKTRSIRFLWKKNILFSHRAKPEPFKKSNPPWCVGNREHIIPELQNGKVFS